MEVEREFLDAMAVIIQSGYYLEQSDFMELIRILNVSGQTTHVNERAMIFEFFNMAAELLEFDVKLLSRVLSEPWEREAQMFGPILSSSYTCRKESQSPP